MDHGVPDDGFSLQRERMLALLADESRRSRVSDPRVLAAMRQVPRHEFVPDSLRSMAYADAPLEIGGGQSISQPLVAGLMTQALGVAPSDRVLEIGTGSGYQAAVLGRLAAEVFTVEILESLAWRAKAVLRRLGFANVRVLSGDGALGWPEAAPFDAVMVTCAADRIPPALVDQLGPEGRLVIPLEAPGGEQELVLARRTSEGLLRERLLPVRFVPMTGEGRRRGGPRDRAA